jgi:hypothetical protein
MTCADCHGSDSITDPNGPHGSAAGFILKGTNTQWDATLVLTLAGMPINLVDGRFPFCANCHDPTFAGSRFPAHRRDGHASLPCVNCHLIIPHGSQRPGLLHAGVGAAVGVVPPAGAVTDQAPYSRPSAANAVVYIRSYPTNSSVVWDATNCGCNGTAPVGPHFNP